MKILWYWPFVRPEELEWARCVAGSEHELVVEVIDRDAAPPAGRAGAVEVRRDLPDVDRSVGGLRWVWSRGRTYLGRARARGALVRQGEFDVVHYHYVNRFTDAWRRPPGLWVLSVHDVMPHNPRLGRLEHALLRWLYSRPDGLIVHHEWIEQALIDDFGVDPERIRIVPHQVFPVETPIERQPGDGSPMVLFFGALRENKGLEVLLQAIRTLPPDAIRLHIAGRGDRHLEELAQRAAAEIPNVTAEIGYVDSARKAELFRACSVVALPYTSFTSQSGVLHDAYGHWRPVAATDVGALGSTVRSDGTGLVSKPGNSSALAKSLARLIGPEGDANASAARLVSVERTPGRAAERTIEAYEHFERTSVRALFDTLFATSSPREERTP